MLRLTLHLLWIAFLTLLTQLGGLAWLAALVFRRRWIAFATAYALLSGIAVIAAPQFGREPLPCFPREDRIAVASPLFCVLNRHYVSPEMAAVADDLAREVPGTRALDGNFPFIDGFPLLPHLSHDDGDKLDFAFYYDGPLPSPIGYFPFENGPTVCPKRPGDLRWDFDILQPLWSDSPLDADRMRAALTQLADDPRVGRILLEPHLKTSLGLTSLKIRFQGCHAARHDDHIHIQL